MKPLRLIIAGGGTGGHLFPGVAVAEELLARDPQNRVLFIGTQQGLEARVLPGLGYPLELINISGLKRVGWRGTLAALWRLPFAIGQSLRIVRRFRPHAVLSVGGYAAGPAGVAAWLSFAPLAVLEQNSYPGITNRILGKLAKAVFGAFDSARAFFPKRTFIHAGNPLRRGVREAVRQRASATGHSGEKPLLFITGGSQGARALNRLAVDALKALGPRAAELRIVHQCGTFDEEAVRKEYAEAGVAAEVRGFIDDMPPYIAAASLVLCRSGATTVAELCAAGKPAVYVPFPYAADNHQERNARDAAAGGGAMVFNQAELTGEKLAQALEKLIFDAHRLSEMGRKALEFDKPRAAADVVDRIYRLARMRPDSVTGETRDSTPKALGPSMPGISNLAGNSGEPIGHPKAKDVEKPRE